MAFWSWSRTPAANATADVTVNYSEGQAPSSLNDSARAVMARLAEYRDDISGAIVTGGTSTAYTVATFEVFDTLAHLNGQMFAFTPHVTNGDTVTINIDGLGAKPLRPSPGVELVAGTLVQGTPYTGLYNHTDGAVYLRGYHSSPYNVPFLGGMDFWDTVTPNSTFIFPAGQAISRSVYSRAFARWGTTFGAGDGSTTFNVPDKTERVSVMKAAVASRLNSTYFGGDSTALGAVGGSQSHTLTAAESAVLSYNFNPPNVPLSPASITNNISYAGGGNVLNSIWNSSGTNAATVGGSVTSNAGGNAHSIVQPTIVCNYILRII